MFLWEDFLKEDNLFLCQEVKGFHLYAVYHGTTIDTSLMFTSIIVGSLENECICLQ